ncbi:MAG: PglZ domain-containing protein [Flavobacteriaceae bacterium]|jgi:CheY-like chemotaxis protein
MTPIKILWVDDEIELLKPHFLFLNDKGYQTTACNNGQDALLILEKQNFDVVLLDENMPGLGGLETLNEIKLRSPNLPVIMITKNEEEHIMEEAIGAKISDYLIKPVNPNQILSALKKLLQHKNLIAEKTIVNYQQAFQRISLSINELETHQDWADFYTKMIYWEIELEGLEDLAMLEIFQNQMKEANRLFSKFIQNNYEQWIKGDNGPLMSHQILKEKLFPILKKESNKPTLMLVIDNLRFDQWKMIAPIIENHYQKEEELSYYSILPTATHYARNAIFSGLMPLEMQKQHPELWVNENEEGGKNLNEVAFLESQLNRNGIKSQISYSKITNLKSGKELSQSLQNHQNNDLIVVVYNFVDMISHAKTEMEIIKELAADNKAFRSLTLSWFKNSPLLEIIQQAKKLGFGLIVTTDHGTINVDQAIEIKGDREVSMNLRYKTGQNLSHNNKSVMEVSDPKKIQLPANHINSKFIFAKEHQYFVYQNNFNHYANHFRNTFQHGGISMEEMIIPFVVMRPR